MSRYQHIASRIFDTPLLIHPGKLRTILDVMMPRFLDNATGYDVASNLQPPLTSSAIYTNDVQETLSGRNPRVRLDMIAAQLGLGGRNVSRADAGYLLYGDTAIIDVMGTLVHRASYLDAMSGVTGYTAINNMAVAAFSDPDVNNVLMLLDTPGGEASGVFELSSNLRKMRTDTGKRLIAYADEMALSGGYMIASAADEIYMPGTALAGSVGVVMTHFDISEAAKKQGVKPTYIFAGEHKVDGNPFEPMPDSVKAAFQADIDALYDVFTSRTAEYRGMSQQTMIDTGARVYRGMDAVNAGLVDGIMSFDELMTSLAAGVSNRGESRTTGVTTMTTETEVQSGQAQARLTDEQVREQYPAVVEAAHAEGFATGVSGERARVSDILTCDDAGKRPKMAMYLATQTDMSAEQAKGLLATAPEETVAKPAPANPLAAAIAAGGGNPDVDADVTTTGADGEQELTPEQAVKAAQTAGLVVVK